MAVTPQTTIRLLKVPIEIDNKNQITFANEQAQRQYFLSLPHLEIDEVSYQRKDNIIYFPEHIDNLLEYNYVMYLNENYTNKWFYAFIENMEYETDYNTAIKIATDVFQTWQFNINFKKSFVEREHVNVSDDIIGKHTIPENLETGEYILDDIIDVPELKEMCYMLRVSEWTNPDDNKPLAVNLGGVWSAGGCYFTRDINTAIQIIQLYQDGREDAILSFYMIPLYFVNTESQSARYPGQATPYNLQKNIDKPSSLDNYSPRNRKLLTFPYCFLNVSNNAGTSNTFQYELFNEDDEYPSECVFNIKGVPTVGGGIKCVPLNYKNTLEEYNEEEGIMAGKFPTLSWSNDEYINWLTQNSVNIGVGVASNLLTIIGGIASGNAALGVSAIANGAMGIANTMGQIYQHSITPNSAKGNINGGDINTCSETNTFYFYKNSIKQEYAKIIDNYFDMFGYKVNDVKIPNITGRPNWNYVKTIDCNITGNIPQEDMQTIKNIFNNGVTLWHNTSTFLDYSQNNR